jgi:hypothetical protein
MIDSESLATTAKNLFQKVSIRRLFGSFQRGDLQPRGHHHRFMSDYRRHLEANATNSSMTNSSVMPAEPSSDEMSLQDEGSILQNSISDKKI